MMNISKYRQIIGKFKALRVVILCVLASLVVGFAKPDLQSVPENATVGMSLGEWVARPAIQPVPESIDVNSDSIALKSKLDIIPIPVKPAVFRPMSFASSDEFSGVLGEVKSRRWLEHAKYSPDLARQKLAGNQTVEFHGVGFPDIRTDRTPQHFFNAVTADPTQWNQLVAWRASKTEGGEAQPIAHVRCMGLSPQAVARRVDRYEHLINEFSQRYNVSSNLVKAVVTEESCFNNTALSHVGAQGLMQLMPETANWLKVRDPEDPKDNLKGGVRYLSSLLREFESVELALAAYNAGPGNVRRYNGVPPFAETRAYLQKVKSNYRRYSAATRLAKGHSS